MVSNPVLVPFPVGLKVTHSVHVSPGPTVRPQLFACMKSEESTPAMVTPVSKSAAELLFVMTIAAGGLLVSTGWVRKNAVEGDRFTLDSCSAADGKIGHQFLLTDSSCCIAGSGTPLEKMIGAGGFMDDGVEEEPGL